MALTKPSIMHIDLDGTLVDSVPDFAWYLDETLKSLGIPTHREAVIDSFSELKSLF